ncbi:hypothetical protein ACJX0J_023573 [Zea mays]
MYMFSDIPNLHLISQPISDPLGLKNDYVDAYFNTINPCLLVDDMLNNRKAIFSCDMRKNLHKMKGCPDEGLPTMSLQAVPPKGTMLSALNNLSDGWTGICTYTCCLVTTLQVGIVIFFCGKLEYQMNYQILQPDECLFHRNSFIIFILQPAVNIVLQTLE